jgi:hypothetical protein
MTSLADMAKTLFGGSSKPTPSVYHKPASFDSKGLSLKRGGEDISADDLQQEIADGQARLKSLSGDEATKLKQALDASQTALNQYMKSQ